MNTQNSVIFEKLYTRLYELLHNLNRYVPNQGCDEILQIYEKLDITKMMIRYLKIMEPYNNLLKNQNLVNEAVEEIFTRPVVVLPMIDLSQIWQQLTSPQKEKIWMSCRLVYMTGFQAIEQSHEEACRKNRETQETPVLTATPVTKEGEKEKLVFDPFVGVGSNNEEYCVTDVYKGMEALEDIKYKDPGVSSLMSFFNIDKLVDVDKITDQLKNMTQEDIEKATNSIQSLLSSNDNHTQKFLKTMLDKIRDQLQNVDLTSGSSPEKLGKLTDIVETVAKSMGPEIEKNKNLDVKSMLNNASGLFKDIADNKDMDPEQRKQIQALTGMFNNLRNDPRKLQNKKYMNEIFQKAGVDPKQVREMTKNFKK